MSKKIKKIKVKNSDNSFSYIPIGIKAENIKVEEDINAIQALEMINNKIGDLNSVINNIGSI